MFVSCAESGKICHWTTHCLSWSGLSWRSGTILSQTSIPRYREYWMTYRRPDFLAVVLFGSSATTSSPSSGDTQEDWKKDILLLECERRGWGRSQIIQPQDSLVLNKSFVLSTSVQLQAKEYAPSSGSKRAVQRLKSEKGFQLIITCPVCVSVEQAEAMFDCVIVTEYLWQWSWFTMCTQQSNDISSHYTNMDNTNWRCIFFCRLCPSSLQPPLQRLTPACRLSTPN